LKKGEGALRRQKAKKPIKKKGDPTTGTAGETGGGIRLIKEDTGQKRGGGVGK